MRLGYCPPVGPREFAIIGLVVVGYALVSRRISTLPITMPIVFVGVGALCSATGLVEVSAEMAAVGVFAEVTLAVILFSDATRISLRRLRASIGLPVRLLGIGLPLTVVFGAIVMKVIFGDWPLEQAFLIAAILAPTDAALGSAVIENESVPARDRMALNVESGLNDGMIVPVVTVCTSLVLGTSRSAASWVQFVAQQIGFGVIVGLAVGFGGVVAIGAAHRAGWSDGRYEQIATFVLPIVALSAATTIEGNGFIAAFVAGMAFGTGGLRPDPSNAVDPEHLTEFTEDGAQLLGVVSFFMFGNLFIGDALGTFGPNVVIASIASLTVVRMLPVIVALFGTGLRMPPKLFIGWFGPRGLASIVFGILLLEDFESAGRPADELFGVITATVGLSVLLHGASASFGAQQYGTWSQQDRITATDAEHLDSMDEAAHAVMPRSRWSRAGRP